MKKSPSTNMLSFNLFGSLTRLHLAGRERSNTHKKTDPNKNTTFIAHLEEHTNTEVHTVGDSKSEATHHDTLTQSEVILENDKEAPNEVNSEYCDNTKPLDIHEEESLEESDIIEYQETKFYRVFTPSFYEDKDKFEKKFFDKNTANKALKRTRMLSKKLSERKMVISSPTNFQRVEDDTTIALRTVMEQEARVLQKSKSLDNLLAIPPQEIDQLNNKFMSVENLVSDQTQTYRQSGTVTLSFEKCHFYKNKVPNDNVDSSESELEPDDVNDKAFGESNLVQLRNMSQSSPEILKSLNQVPETSTPPLNKFPVGNDNVTLRRDPTCRNRKSKTEDFDRVKGQNFTWNHQSIEIRGVLKIQSTDGVNQIVKHGTEYILYKDDTLWMKNEKKHQQICLKSGVIINDVYYRPKESKEVSFTTNKGVTFTLQFSSSKDAKQFFENCNIRRYIPDKNRPVVTDNKSTVRNMLLKFLRKRKSQEFLEQKGIYKNEPIFGNTLREIHEITRKPVPEFISNIIELIEKPENIKSLGLYRTSGNLATIQKIRLDVDNGNLKVLNQFSKDPDVLTGSLKLFLRELKEPLIPWEVYDKLSDLSKVDLKQLTSKDHQKVKTTLTKHLHEANLETFYVIIRHLVEVVKYKEFNKMDSYNLAVCWGPSIMPSLNSMSTLECTKDIVSQSHNAARLVNFLIDYYEMYPSALNRRTESMSEKFSSLKRQESKDSVESGDSSTRSYKKSNSSTSLSVDIVIKTAIDFIETYWSNDNGDGLYKKRGNSDKTNKILKRLNKKKSNELIKYKNDVNEVAGALKKYLTDCQEQLVDRTTVEILAMTYDNTINSPEQMAREDVLTHLERSPKKDSLLYLLRHFAKVVNHPDIYHISKNELIELWTKILNHDYRIHPSDQKFSKFLTVAIEVCNLPDVVRSSFNNNGNTQNRNMAEVLKDLKNHQQERDRGSRYDNIDCGVAGEASVLNNSEQTKL